MAPGRFRVRRYPVPRPGSGRVLVGIRCMKVYKSSVRKFRFKPFVPPGSPGRGVKLNRRITKRIMGMNTGIAGFGPKSGILVRPKIPSSSYRCYHRNHCGVYPTMSFVTARPGCGNTLYRCVARPRR